jgi:hypothetical protein
MKECVFMKILKGFALALVLASSVIAPAQAAGKNKKALNPWVDCGIGAGLFPRTDWAAVSSNVIWDLGTTAVTSDQSSQNTCNGKNAKVAMYIGATFANLAEETVQGDGTHLRAMLQVAGCESEVHRTVIAALRTDFSQYLRTPGYAVRSDSQKAQDYYNLVQTNVEGQYAQQCQAV